MDAKMVSPFLEAFFSVLPAVGMSDVRRGSIALKEKLLATRDITALVGLSGDIRGNVAYCMGDDTARGVASVMMMGMPVDRFDEMAQSAISELANMLTSGASTAFSGQGLFVNISPPTLITGQNVKVMVSQVRTLSIEIITEAGLIEINVGLEV